MREVLVRTREAVALTLLLISPFSVALADSPDPSTLVHVDPGKEITFDLDRGRVISTLPFDVPFFLVSEIPNGSKKIEVTLGIPDAKPRECDRDCDCECDEDRYAKRVDQIEEKSSCPNGRPIPARIFKEIKDSKTTYKAEISVPKLDVDKNYCFRIELTRKRTKEESDEIVKQLTPLLRRLYFLSDAPTVASLVGNLEFRTAIFNAIQRAVLPAVVVPERNSYLDLRDRQFASLTQRQLFEMPLQAAVNTRNTIDRYLSLRRENNLRRDPALPSDPTVADIDAELDLLQGEIGDTADTALILSLQNVKQVVQRLDAQIEKVARAIDEWLVDHYDVVATTTAGFEARFHWYVSADLGIGVAPEIDSIFGYVGMNVYFRPVNKKAPLHGLDFWRRFAVTVGVGSDALTGNDRSGVFRDRPVLLGGGFRINDHIRLSVGGQFIKEDDPNPLITRKTLAVTPYVSASIDYDLANTLKSFFSAFLPK